MSESTNKALPNFGAGRARLLDALITDEDTAHEMLDLLNSEQIATDPNARTP